MPVPPDDERRYLTNNLELPAFQEILGVVKGMLHKDKDAFIRELEEWHGRLKGLLKERTTVRNGKCMTVHAQDVVLRISQPQAQHAWLWAYQDILACTYRTPTTHPHTSVDRHSYNPVDVILPDQSYFVFKIFGA